MRAFTDGGSRGNPGPAACAVYYPETGRSIGQYVGNKSNNFAEYAALLLALDIAVRAGGPALEVFSDSQLMVKQINGEYAVKSENVRPLYEKAKSLITRIPEFSITYVPRAQNKEADRKVNEVLDQHEEKV